MQSITDTYDNQDRVIRAIGFKDKDTITIEFIDEKHANTTRPGQQKSLTFGVTPTLLLGSTSARLLKRPSEITSVSS
jgi:enoyl-[acyl-carrier-protein] reductase (NADH)